MGIKAFNRFDEYALYLLTQRRGIIVRHYPFPEQLIAKLAEGYNALVVSDYAKYAAMTAAETKKYNLFIFMDADKNLIKWSQPAVQKLSRQKTRANRFVFFMDKYLPMLKACYIFSKCTERSVGDLKHRFCEVGTGHNGSLLYTTTDRRERELEELWYDHGFSCVGLGADWEDDGEHSRFGPSGLAQLAKCPGSLWMDEPYETSTGAADFGTTWHNIAEHYLTELKEPPENSPVYEYVTACRNNIKMHEEWKVEQFLHDPTIHDEFWGTADFYSYDRKRHRLTVIDYKNGKYPVKAENNMQLKAYAVLASHHLGVQPKQFMLCIAQRGKGMDGWIVDGTHLPKWRKEIKDVIKKALAAEKEPHKHLNHKECYSAFCPARDLHKDERKKYAIENASKEADGKAQDKAGGKAASGTNKRTKG